MYIAMNRFKVAKGQEDAFEQVWRSRQSYLSELPGFISFHLLRGPSGEDHTLMASHTTWETKADFDYWTTSEQFKKAHSRAEDPNRAPLPLLGHPHFEGFEILLSEFNTTGQAPLRRTA